MYKTKETALRKLSEGENFANKPFDMFRDDKEVAYIAVKKEYKNVSHIDKELLQDIDFVKSIAGLGKNTVYEIMRNEDLKNNKEVALEAVKGDAYSYRCFGDEIRNDKDVILSAIKQNGRVIEDMGSEVRDNENIVRLALENGGSLYKVSDRLKSDRDFALYAMSKNGYGLSSLPEQLRSDIDVVKTAIINNGYAIDSASEELKKNRELVLLASQNIKSQLTLDYVKEFNGDREIVLNFIKHDGSNLRYINESLKSDKELTSIALDKIDNQFLKNIEIDQSLLKDVEIVKKLITLDSDYLEKASDELRANKDIVDIACKKSTNSIRFASEDIRNDKEFINKYVSEKNPYAFQYVGDKLKDDLEFVKPIVENFGHNIQFVSDRLKNNVELAKSAVENDYNVFNKINEELRDNKELCLTYLNKSSNHFPAMGVSVRSDMDVVKLAIKDNPNNIKFAEPSIYDNREKIEELMKVNNDVYCSLSWESKLKDDDELGFSHYKKCLENKESIYLNRLDTFNSLLRDDKEFVLEAVQKNPLNLNHVSDRLKEDRDIVFEAMKQDPSVFKFASHTIKCDEDIIKLAVKNDGLNLEHTSATNQNNPEVVMLAVQQNGNSLRFASMDLISDREIVKEAVKQNYNSFEFVSHDLKNDKAFIVELIEETKSLKFLNHASTEIKNNKEVMLEAFKKDNDIAPDFLGYQLKKELGDKEPVKALESMVLADKLQNQLAQRFNQTPTRKLKI